MKVPGPDHPITITPAPRRVRVTFGGQTVADSRRALVLKEASYPPVFYIPREDAALALLQKSETKTYCPYKGDCSYYTIAASGHVAPDAIWSYEQPYEAMAAIAGHLAFYPNRVDQIEETD